VRESALQQLERHPFCPYGSLSFAADKEGSILVVVSVAADKEGGILVVVSVAELRDPFVKLHGSFVPRGGF